jgi:DMSO/TMAO reductase YedYZ molybdopterin-dependent catalytic subunit
LRLVYEDAYGYDWVKYVEEIIVSWCPSPSSLSPEIVGEPAVGSGS